jgi:L,D-peptidoglycan transpeptidase YkuD (ErfK/YbiS/YcfS/YnhG family)
MMKRLTRLTAAPLLLTACHGLNLTPRPSHAVLSVNPTEIHVQRRGFGYWATIPFVYVNTTAAPVSKVSCGIPSPFVEKKVNGRWVHADDEGLIQCRSSPDFSIGSGRNYSSVVRWIAHERGHNTGPELRVDSIGGIYRLRWDFVEGTVADAPGARKVETVSNEFRMTLSDDRLSFATQLVVVTTAGWDSTTGELRRFSRDHPYAYWREEGRRVPIVVGRTGLAWGVGFDSAAVAGAPHKREGDGRSPAGIFPIDTAFGFAPTDSMRSLHLPYVALTSNSECVDDTASAHYNTVVDRSAVPSVDWQSSEKMRKVGQYQLGAIIGYNAAPPVKARGSCIFFHIWNGPRSTTVGCTALDATELARLIEWLDRKSQPVVVQIPASVYPHLRQTLGLPLLER